MAAYCLTRLYVLPGSGIFHTKLRVALPGYPLPEITGFAFWPHLGPSRYQPRLPFEIQPALRMDWAASRFDPAFGISNLLQPEGPEVGWWLLSLDSIVKGEDNVLDFENPFAHYDLARDSDGWAELVIRHVYTPPGKAWYVVGNIATFSPDPQHTSQIVRYSWDQDNDGIWDYKLGLIGRNLLQEVAAFPDFGLVTIPYQHLPRTLTEDMSWEAVTFVQVEGQAERSPEGVYEWDDIYNLSRQYLFGIGDELDPQMNDIRARFRGEYSVQTGMSPRLYLSPVDRKLHLLGAQAGVWNLDGVQRLRYSDLDGDCYLDQWTLTEQLVEAQGGDEQGPEHVRKSLRVAHEIWVYTDAGKVSLVRSAQGPSLFEAPPPRDHSEWLALGQQLERHHRDFAPGDFVGMLEQFDGPATEVEGAQLEDFRLTQAGFRFVLRLQPGFHVHADENDIGLTDLPSGSYVLAYDGALHLQPLTPPLITVPTGEIFVDPATPQQMQWVTIQVVVHNEGLRDVQSLPVRLYAAREGAEPLLLLGTVVAVPGQGQHTLLATWPPAQAGPWTIWLEADAAEALPLETELGHFATLEIDVVPAAMPDMFQPVASFDGLRFTWPVAVLLASAGLAAISALGMLVTQTPNTDASEPGYEE
jgi:hypothetical protein